VTTCLQKNPEERFQTAHDVKLELQWIAADKSSPAVAAAPPGPSRSRERLGWAAAVVMAIVLGVVAGVFIRLAAWPTISPTCKQPGYHRKETASLSRSPPLA
jgi:hypothetical protein